MSGVEFRSVVQFVKLARPFVTLLAFLLKRCQVCLVPRRVLLRSSERRAAHVRLALRDRRCSGSFAKRNRQAGVVRALPVLKLSSLAAATGVSGLKLHISKNNRRGRDGCVSPIARRV